MLLTGRMGAKKRTVELIAASVSEYLEAILGFKVYVLFSKIPGGIAVKNVSFVNSWN